MSFAIVLCVLKMTFDCNVSRPQIRDCSRQRCGARPQSNCARFVNWLDFGKLCNEYIQPGENQSTKTSAIDLKCHNAHSVRLRCTPNDGSTESELKTHNYLMIVKRNETEKKQPSNFRSCMFGNWVLVAGVS